LPRRDLQPALIDLSALLASGAIRSWGQSWGQALLGLGLGAASPPTTTFRFGEPPRPDP
jgi:hypothetical protein